MLFLLAAGEESSNCSLMNYVKCLFWDLKVIKDGKKKKKKPRISFGKVAKVFWRAEWCLINHHWQKTVMHFLR